MKQKIKEELLKIAVLAVVIAAGYGILAAYMAFGRLIGVIA